MSSETKTLTPLPELPIYEPAAREGAGTFEERFRSQLTVETLFRFVYGNLGYTEADAQQVADCVLQNVPLQPNLPVWMMAALLYFLGVLDGVRLEHAQAELDAQRVRNGRVM